MHLSEVVPDAETMIEFEPSELGLRMLTTMQNWRHILFGPLELGTYIRFVFGAPDNPQSAYSGPLKSDADLAIRAAWGWLEGNGLLVRDPNYLEPNTVRVLSRQARELATSPAAREIFVRRTLPRSAVHPEIREKVWGLYMRGDYDLAVFAAMKEVEVVVRAASRLDDEIGKTLMRKAFAPGGPLTDPEADTGEQDGMSALFSGAIQVCKNPQSHRHVAITTPDEAAEIIMLASYLLRIVARRRDAIVAGWYEPQS